MAGRRLKGHWDLNSGSPRSWSGRNDQAVDRQGVCYDFLSEVCLWASEEVSGLNHHAVECVHSRAALGLAPPSAATNSGNPPPWKLIRASLGGRLVVAQDSSSLNRSWERCLSSISFSLKEFGKKNRKEWHRETKSSELPHQTQSTVSWHISFRQPLLKDQSYHLHKRLNLFISLNTIFF